MSSGMNTQQPPRFDPKLVERFRPRTLSEIADLPPLTWLVERHVPEDGLIVLYGEPNAGKTFITLDWALSIAAGIPWLGRSVQAGEVVYIYAEGIRGILQRCEAWRQEHGLAEVPAQFRAVACPVNMLERAEWGSLLQAILDAGLSPRLIVLDTLARCFGAGDENQTRDMNAFVHGCGALREGFPGASVLVVHHTGKNAERGARGSIALTAAADVEFQVEPSAVGGIKLRNTKQKDSAHLPDQRLQLVPAGDSCVIRAADAAQAQAAAGKAAGGKKTEDAVFFALLSLGLQGASYTAWLDASGRKKPTFNRHREALVKAGRVKKLGELYCCAVVSFDDIPDEALEEGTNSED
jgi:AAA domain